MSYTVILCLCMSMYCSDLFGMSIDLSSYWDLFWVLGASDWFGVALGGSCAPPVLGGSTKSQDDFY